MAIKSQIRVALSDREQEIVCKVANELDVKDCEVLGSVIRTWLTSMALNKLSLIESGKRKS